MTSDLLDRLAEVRPSTDPAGLYDSDERDRLYRAIVTGASVEGGSRPSRHRLLALALSTAAAVALLTAAVDTGTDGVTAPPATSAARPDLIVLERVSLAVAQAEDLVLHVRNDLGNGVVWQSWADEQSGRARMTSTTPDGRPIYDHEFRVLAGGLHVRVVSYGDKAWWEYATPDRDAGGMAPTPSEIRGHLDDGTLVEVATERGRAGDEVHLRWEPSRAPSNIRLTPGDLWVDADSYLPLRARSESRGVTSTVDYEWLPKNEANLAAVDMPIPDGFRHLPGAPDDRGDGPGQG